MMKSKSNTGSHKITRRKFLGNAAAGSAALAFSRLTGMISPFRQAKWPADAANYRIHLIGQAHIDPVWLWPWQEGIAVVHSTFRSALDRMNEAPGFCFTASSAQFYQWIAENDPGMLAEIRQRVDEGRWNIAGGWWVEPDMNIPCGEAMVRQGLYGQLTFRRLLGRTASVAYNPDSFGHTGTLPQIIKLQGMENYVFMRPGINEKTLPADIFWWESPDGSRVLAYRIPVSYNDSRSVRARLMQVMPLWKDQPAKTLMSYYGAGDHGGGATKENISSITEIQAENDAPAILFSTPEKYFNEIRDAKGTSLPVVRDDLQHHATGCYTAESEIKKGNRSAETALITAEKISAIGSASWGSAYPAVEFASAWKSVLFLQFHDSLAGSSLPEHSQAAREGFGYASDIAHKSMYKALQKLEWQIGTEDPASQYLVAFNPHAWQSTGVVEYDLNWDLKNPSRVDDENGNPLMHQWSAGTTEAGNRRKLVVRTPLPASGYRQLRIRQGESPRPANSVIVTANSLENEFLKLTIGRSGTIGLTDKKSGVSFFGGGETGCRAVIIDDPSDTWSHDIKAFTSETGSFGNAAVRILEKGPLRGILRVVSTYGSSTLTADWIVYADSSCPEARITLDWHEHLKMLKFSFPVNAQSPVATYETPYGFIVRQTNGNEDPGQRWIDVTGLNAGRTIGLTVINDAKYGYSVNGSDLRISVARSAVYAHHIPRVLDMTADHLWQDQGIQTFRMLLVPHEGSWQDSGIVRIADEFTAPPVIIYQGIHGGTMPKTRSFLSIDPGNVIVTSIKQAEGSDDIILRCVELEGKPASAGLNIGFAGVTWKGKFRPGEIKSLRIERGSGKITEVSLLEE